MQSEQAVGRSVSRVEERLQLCEDVSSAKNLGTCGEIVCLPFTHVKRPEAIERQVGYVLHQQGRYQRQ